MGLMNSEEKKNKMAKENAVKEFQRIVDCFGFNVSDESTKRIVTMDINNIPMVIQQEVVDSEAFVRKIMQGKITFDEESETLTYHLRKEIRTGEEGSVSTKSFTFGQVTAGTQRASKIELNKCNFSTLPDKDQLSLLEAMTGVSDDEVFMKLTIPQIHDIRMIAQIFFN